MNLATRCWGLLLAVCLFSDPLYAGGKYYEVNYPASEVAGELVYPVTYYLWVPESREPVRGVLVHQHGCGTGAEQGGISAAQDLHWQALAQKWNCALLGSNYQAGDGKNCRLWCDSRAGSEQTFLRSLADFAKQSERPEIATVPWCLWGHSGGAYWASLMQAKHPERIVAIWLRSGTAYPYWMRGEVPAPEIPAAAYQIPVMANPGLKEKTDPRFAIAWDGSVAMWQAFRAQGAPFGVAPDPRTGHECGDSRYLAIPFFDACLEQRLPANGDTALRPINFEHAWFANLDGSGVASAQNYAGDTKQAIWLPNEKFAHLWSEYFRTGAVDDKTPPPAPTDFKVERVDGGLQLTWEITADFESGLSGFVIERNGQALTQLPEQPVGRFGRALFQTMSYHDTPERPVPELKFLDRTAPAGTPVVYSIRAVNSVGLKSEPTTKSVP